MFKNERRIGLFSSMETLGQ